MKRSRVNWMVAVVLSAAIGASAKPGAESPIGPARTAPRWTVSFPVVAPTNPARFIRHLRYLAGVVGIAANPDLAFLLTSGWGTELSFHPLWASLSDIKTMEERLNAAARAVAADAENGEAALAELRALSDIVARAYADSERWFAAVIAAESREVLGGIKRAETEENVIKAAMDHSGFAVRYHDLRALAELYPQSSSAAELLASVYNALETSTRRARQWVEAISFDQMAGYDVTVAELGQDSVVDWKVAQVVSHVPEGDRIALRTSDGRGLDRIPDVVLRALKEAQGRGVRLGVKPGAGSRLPTDEFLPMMIVPAGQKVPLKLPRRGVLKGGSAGQRVPLVVGEDVIISEVRVLRKGDKTWGTIRSRIGGIFEISAEGVYAGTMKVQEQSRRSFFEVLEGLETTGYLSAFFGIIGFLGGHWEGLAWVLAAIFQMMVYYSLVKPELGTAGSDDAVLNAYPKKDTIVFLKRQNPLTR